MADLGSDDKEYKESFGNLILELSSGLNGVVKTLKSSIQGFSMHTATYEARSLMIFSKWLKILALHWRNYLVW